MAVRVRRGFRRLGLVCGGILALVLGLGIGIGLGREDSVGPGLGLAYGLAAAVAGFVAGWAPMMLIGWVVSGFVSEDDERRVKRS